MLELIIFITQRISNSHQFLHVRMAVFFTMALHSCFIYLTLVFIYLTLLSLLVCVCKQVCVQRLQVRQSVFLSHFSTLFFKTGSLSNTCTQLDWPACEFQGSFCVYFIDQRCCSLQHLKFECQFWGSQLRSSCFQGKHVSNTSIFSALRNIYLCLCACLFV